MKSVKDTTSCEKNHKISQAIISARHSSKGQNNTGYPITITVRISNGQDIIYKR